MSDPTMDAEVVTAASEKADSARPKGAPRRREPSARKLRAAALYASGKAKTLKAAIVEAGGSPTGVARVPGPNGWGSVELVRTDLEYNPQPTGPAAMLRDGFSTLHKLATRGESESIRGASADRLIGRLQDAGVGDESNEITPLERFGSWLFVRQATRRGIRAGVRLVARYGLVHALDVLAAHEEIEVAREARRRPPETLEPPPRFYRSGRADE